MKYLKKSKDSNRYQWWYSIVIFFFSFLFVIVAGELLVRILVPKEFYLPISNIYRAVSTDNRYTLKPNFNGTAFGVPLKTNSLGFRGKEWALRKNNNSVRIALLGDSHAFGYGVTFNDTVGEKLAALLNEQGPKKFEVLNFGVVGYNSRQELAVLHSDVLKFKPDLLIVIPCSNDHKENLIADDNGFLRTVNNTDVNDESVDKLKITAASWLITKSKMVFYLLFIKKQYELSGEINTLREPHDENAVKAAGWWMGPFSPQAIPEQLKTNVYDPLKEMISEAKQRDMPIIIANFNAVPAYRQLFAQLAQEEEVPSLELLALFPEANSWQELLQKFGLGWNNHLNANAHERWAQALAQIVTKLQK